MYFATKADLVYSLASHRDEVISYLKGVYDTPDDSCYVVISGSEESGDLVSKEIGAPLPRWKQLGFTTRAEIKDIIGAYSDDILSAAIAKKTAEHQSHVARMVVSAENKSLKAIAEKIKSKQIEVRGRETPTSSTGGNLGSIAWDDNYLYLWVNDNSVKRIALADF
jgi:hypothetical protein